METPYELQPDDIQQPLNFVEAGRHYEVKHFLRVPALKDWLVYDSALGITMVDVATDAGVGISHRGNRTAALGALWDRLVLRVEGYAEPLEANEENVAGKSARATQPAWMSMVPFLHKVAAVTPRTQVFAVSTPAAKDAANGDVPALYSPGLTPVHLIAAGGIYLPLVHWFRRAEAAQIVEFDRINTERIYFRATAREGAKAVIPSMLAGYVKLYDELIDSVEGYTVHGAGTTREQAVNGMDAWHKQVALRGLFNPPAPDEPADEAAVIAA